MIFFFERSHIYAFKKVKLDKFKKIAAKCLQNAAAKLLHFFLFLLKKALKYEFRWVLIAVINYEFENDIELFPIVSKNIIK